MNPRRNQMLLLLNFECVYQMRYLISFFSVIFLLVSCHRTEKFPPFATTPVHRINYDDLPWSPSDLSAADTDSPAVSPGLKSLLANREFYFQKDERFELKKFRTSWEQFRKESESMEFSEKEALSWFYVTAFLFELTGDPDVAEELGRIHAPGFGNLSSGLRDSLIAPYIITKNLDQVSVNLFLPAEIHYTHSMGGEVSVKQETDFTKNGKVLLRFSMKKKRFIAVNVHIPSRAFNVSVEVKGVKYVAQPGSYCVVAKKWKEGDVIEINFSAENLPE